MAVAGTMAEQPFEIELATNEDTGEIVWYFARGHIDTSQFFRAVEDGYAPGVPAGYVRQTYWRNVPRGDGWTEYVEGRGRGAYPVTILEAAEYRADQALPHIIEQNEQAHRARGCRCHMKPAPCELRRMIQRQRDRLQRAYAKEAHAQEDIRNG